MFWPRPKEGHVFHDTELVVVSGNIFGSRRCVTRCHRVTPRNGSGSEGK
jgi:hypothetical protein